MKLFLDSSVLLAACGSARGASRALFRLAVPNQWLLLATPYVIEEVNRNLPMLPPKASEDWARLQTSLRLAEDVFTLDRPAVFAAHKDRPVLFSALAWADVLLTLDEVHFSELMVHPFYGLRVYRPGQFIDRQRAAETFKDI